MAKIEYTGKRFRNYFYEFVVVFLGISLAFIFERLYENYKEYSLEKEYLKSIALELKANGRTAMEFSQLNSEASLKLGKYQNVESLSKDSLLYPLSLIIRQAKIEPEISAFETIKAAGNLNLISNELLRNDIVKVYLNLNDLKFVDEAVNRVVHDYNMEFALKNFNFQEGSFNFSGSSLSIQYFGNLIFTYTQLLNASIESYRNIAAECDSVATKIEKELD